MPSSTQIVVAKGPDPKMASDLHQCVIFSGAVSAASAVLCGLELQAVKRELKKTSSLTFLEWYEQHQHTLGFSLSTKDRYMRAAEETKAKLIKTRDPAVLALLEKPQIAMTQAERRRLLDAVRKCIGVKTLMGIYLEAGIVRNVHKAPDWDGSDRHALLKPPSIEEEVMEQLELFGQRTALLRKTYKLGSKPVLVAAHWPKPKLKTAIAILERDLALLRGLEGAGK